MMIPQAATVMRAPIAAVMVSAVAAGISFAKLVNTAAGIREATARITNATPRPGRDQGDEVQLKAATVSCPVPISISCVCCSSISASGLEQQRNGQWR
jgi:hypothetical protein